MGENRAQVDSHGHHANSYVEALLGRWSRWYHWGERPGPRQVISSWGPLILDRNVEQSGKISRPCPVDQDEASETHKAVMALSPELRDTVFECYLKGGMLNQKMRALGIKRRETYYARLERAYRLILGYLNDMACGIPLPEVRPSEPVMRARRPVTAKAA